MSGQLGGAPRDAGSRYNTGGGTAHLELLDYVARAIQRDRLLVLATYRGDEIHRLHPLPHLIAGLGRERLLREVRIEMLAPAEVARMVEQLLGGGVPAETVAALHEHTGGNPFFFEELASTLHSWMPPMPPMSRMDCCWA